MSHTLALDIGTSSLRAMLLDAQGVALPGVLVRKGYNLATTPDGGVTLDPQHLLQLCVTAIDEVLQQAGSRRIARVAMDTLVANLLGVDGAGEPLTPLYTWADTRGAELADRLDTSGYTQRSGCRLHTSYWPLRILWLQTAQPQLFRRVKHWLSFGEYLFYKLFGQRRISISVASWSGLLDRHRLTWDRPMLEQLPLDSGQLSAISNEALQGLATPWAARWPALKDALWFPAIGDGVAANLGAGCSRPGHVALSLGTSGAMRVVVPGTPVQTPAGLFVYRIDDARSLVGGALSNAGNLYAWLQRVLADVDEEVLAAMAPDSHGLTVLPFLAGERAPGWRDEARAVFAGMTFDTAQEHLLRAALEAVACRFALILQRLRPLLPADPRFIANGAALRQSPLWLQIMADVLGAPVHLCAEEEATIRGAALLAMRREPAPETGAGCQPRMEYYPVYQEAIARQQGLYDRLLLH
ncbi:MAG: gluconokinase [Anaerolineae bacterium]|nr:gluconokinase [Anaerolineae bacterium]